MSSTVTYAREQGVSASEFRRVLVDSGLGVIRPVDDEARLEAMLRNADLIVTARRDGPGGALLGVARCVTDFSWVCYLSDLAVSADAQGLGIGKGLVRATQRELGPAVAIALISVPDATGFYERIGMARQGDAFWLRRQA